MALAIFALAWLAYEPLVKAALGRRHMINLDMAVIRASWMRSMAGRDNRLMDGQLLGHTINSASFFASSNLILIAAAAGVLFGGEAAFRSASSLIVIKTSSRLLFELQLALTRACAWAIQAPVSSGSRSSRSSNRTQPARAR